MERKIVERRTVLKGGAAAVGMLGSGASASMVAGVQQASADTPPSSVPDQILAAFQRFRETIPANFDHEYVEKAVRPFFLTSFYEGERPMLPMIDVTFSKENALPYDLWGLITRDWRPTPEDGVTVFLQGLEKRGPNNLRKRIYFSGGDAGPLQANVWPEGRRLLRQTHGQAIREQTVHAALPRLLFRPLLGPSPWSDRGRHPLRGTADW